MPLKFSANLSFLYAEEGDLEKRIFAAAHAGFTAVEIGTPYVTSPERLSKVLRQAEVDVLLINSPAGGEDGGLGLAAIPDKQEEFQESLETSIKYAKALKCSKVHILAGIKPPNVEDKVMMDIYMQNLRYAANRLEKEGIVGLIEAINTEYSFPNYFMDHPDKAIECLQQIDHPSMKLLLDVYHLQCICGNLTSQIEKLISFAGHVQIAQAPTRGPPNSPGEINYQYILSIFEKLDYTGFIGLEFKCSGNTARALEWLVLWKYQLLPKMNEQGKVFGPKSA